MTPSTRLQLLKWQFLDDLRHSRWLRTLNAERLYLVARFNNARSSAELLSRALAFSQSLRQDEIIMARLKLSGDIQRDAPIWLDIVRNLPR